jgi:hypothetical protein
MIINLTLAKSVFQVRSVDAPGKVVVTSVRTGTATWGSWLILHLPIFLPCRLRGHRIGLNDVEHQSLTTIHVNSWSAQLSNDPDGLIKAQPERFHPVRTGRYGTASIALLAGTSRKPDDHSAKWWIST